MDFMHGSFVYIVAEVVTCLLLFIGGFFIGKIREKQPQSRGKKHCRDMSYMLVHQRA